MPHRPDQDASARAAQLLVSLGWQELSTHEGLSLRAGRKNSPLLQFVLEEQLKRINSPRENDRRSPLSKAAVERAVQTLRDHEQEDLLYASEKIWLLLKHGTQVSESSNDSSKSVTVRYVDWKNPQNNAFQFVREFSVEGANGACSVDMVLFVNGIPFIALEAKSVRSKIESTRQLSAAIDQLQQYQRPGYAPQLFRYIQLLLAACMRAAAYGVVGADRQQWAQWQELQESAETLDDVLREHVVAAPKAPLLVANEQDRLIYALCRPGRLLDLVHSFTLFRSGRRHIARYYQHSAIQAVLRQVCKPEIDGRRPGGIVWHTQGTGKSLTMAMLAQVLLDKLQPHSARAVLVTDRSVLDEQLHQILLNSGVECRQANTGRELRNLLRNPQARAITTVVQKFGAAMNSDAMISDSPHILVLIDEAHRTQSGQLHYAMRRMLPRACFIGFTGIPLSINDKRASDVFGEYLAKYTSEQAIQDNILLPVEWELHKLPWVSIGPQGPNSFGSEARLQAIVDNITAEYSRRRSRKGLLVAPSRTAALLFKQHLDAVGTISSEVAISLDDDDLSTINEKDETLGSAASIQRFRQEVLSKFGSGSKYEADLLRRFRDTDDPKLLIVVDKFLTGFDVPRLDTLYITRPLRGHQLVQAIARVNRQYPGKERALVADYVGLVSEARQALAATIDVDFKTTVKDLFPAKADVDTSHESTTKHDIGARLLSSSTRARIEIPPATLESSFQQILEEELAKARLMLPSQAIQHLAQKAAENIYFNRKVEWISDLDLQNRMKTLIEDDVFEMQSEQGVVLTLESIDAILDRCVAAAKAIVR